MNIKTLVHKIRYGSTVEWYNFWYIALLPPAESNPPGSFH